MTTRQKKQQAVKQSLLKKLRDRTNHRIAKHGLITQDTINKWYWEHIKKS